MTPRIGKLTLGTTVVALAITALVTALPFVAFAYRSPSAHVAIETMASLTGLLVAYLVYWRFTRSGSRSDLLLFSALGLHAAATLLFSALPAVAGGSGSFVTWTPAIGRFMAAALLAWAAVASDRQIARPRRAALHAMGGGVVLLGAIAILVALSAGSLPIAIEPTVSPTVGPRFAGDPSVLVLNAVQTLLYAAATLGFARRARRDGDELMGWLAIASVLGGFARVNYLLFPSLYSPWIYTGDFFRLGFFLVLLVGAAREIQTYHHAEMARATLEERRRIARELHDGLAQELTFIAGETRAMNAFPDDRSQLPHIATAAERALDEARDAIAALTKPVNEPLDVLISRAARQAATRVGAGVELDLGPGAEPSPEARAALVRIVREAVANATRHGRAGAVRVRLARTDGIRLVVSDDGSGFDMDARLRESSGFGLTSMSERAAELGGRLHVRSAPGMGTTVEVAIP